MTDYSYQEYRDGSNVSVCLTLADTFWSKTYFLGGTFIFFVIPLAILVILYSMMALNLMSYPGIVSFGRQDNSTSAQRYRKQVILMLGTVVLFFFISLLPFRALIVWIVLVPHEEVMALGNEKYYNLLYFCRIMFYLNSAINPILYNLMSTKFRNGFFKICGIKKKCFRKHTRALLRNSTFNTSSLTAITTSSIHRASLVEGGHHRDRSRSLTSRSLKNEQFRRDSCSKSLLRDLNQNSRHGCQGRNPNQVVNRKGMKVEKCHCKLYETDKNRLKRRKSFGDFASMTYPCVTMNLSRSLDSVLKAKMARPSRNQRTFKLNKNDVDFVSFSNKVHISMKDENISRERRMQNGCSLMRNSTERKLLQDLMDREADRANDRKASGSISFARQRSDEIVEIFV